MSSIIKPNLNTHTKLNALGLQGVSAANLNAGQIHKDLNKLFDDHLRPDYVTLLMSPWVKTLQFIGIANNVSAYTEQERWLNGISTSANKLRSNLQQWQKEGLTLDLSAFLCGADLDLDTFYIYLAEIERVVNFCMATKEFGNGGKYSPNRIKRYGIFALFYLGMAAGLKHEGKPSPLFTFVKIITQLDQKTVSAYHSEFTKISIKDELHQNPIFEYIFNPATLTDELYNKVSLYRQRFNLRPYVFPLRPENSPGLIGVRFS